MEDPLSRLCKPLLTDGAAKTNLWLDGMPMYSCPAQWMLENPDRVQKLQRRFLQAGSQLLCTPTAQADADSLKQWDQQQNSDDYNERLARLTVESCREANPHALAAGVIAPLQLQAEPFGETPFFDLINLYARQAFALKRGGVDLLLADTMTTLSQSRAAILGCRQTGLPVMVTMNVEEDGETCMGSDLVSALITCQKLGAVAFGLSCCDRPEKLYGHIEEIAPYAKVPIIVRPRAGEDFDKLLSPREMAEQMKGLLQRGATILGGCCYTTPEHIEAIGRMMQTFDFSAVRRQREDEDTIGGDRAVLFGRVLRADRAGLLPAGYVRRAAGAGGERRGRGDHPYRDGGRRLQLRAQRPHAAHAGVLLFGQRGGAGDGAADVQRLRLRRLPQRARRANP